MGYTPLFDTLLTGSLHGRWPHTGVWACLLSRVSREGTIDEHPRMLAAAIGISEQELMRCIDDFCAQDIHSRTEDSGGRKLELIDPGRPWGWRVINHAKYKEKARKKSYDQERTDSGADAARKRAERVNGHHVPTCPDTSRALPLSSPTHSHKDLKKATQVAKDEEPVDNSASQQPPAWRREEGRRWWPQVLDAIRDDSLRKLFPPDSDVARVVNLLGGWRELGLKHRDLRGQTEQRFLNTYADLKPQSNGLEATA